MTEEHSSQGGYRYGGHLTTDNLQVSHQQDDFHSGPPSSSAPTTIVHTWPLDDISRVSTGEASRAGFEKLDGLFLNLR